MSVANSTVFSSDNKIEKNGIMIRIDAKGLDYATINGKLRNTKSELEILNCCGQRFIAAGMSDKAITITGTPGNALGAHRYISAREHSKHFPNMIGRVILLPMRYISIYR